MVTKWPFLNIEERKETEIHNVIVEHNLFDLKNPKFTRTDEALLTMSLGLAAPSEITKKKSVVRGEYISMNQEAKALMVAAMIGGISGDNVMNEQMTKDNICDYVDRCSNTGYDVLVSYLETPLDNRELHIIEKYLDNLFEEIRNDN